MPKDLIFDLSPTQSAYVHSNAEIVMIMGNMASGKTYASIVAPMAHAARCGRDIRGAVIRDTHQNLKTSTVPDIKEVLKSWATFHDDDKKLVIHSTPKVEMDLFGIDDPASLSKLQGPQYAIIWLEEPAPIIQRANAGLPREVFDMAVARASRQVGTRMRVQVSQNPADEDHWTEELASSPEIYAEDPESGVQIRKEVYRIHNRENKYLDPQVRAANIAAFKDDPGKFARYVEGRAAPVMLGKKVTPEYNPTIHYSDKVLPVIHGAVGIRGWDAWQNPACVIGQLIPPGKLWIHDVVVGENIGVNELIDQSVLPLLNTPKYKNKIDDWRDIGDPTMRTPDQSTTQMTAARRVEDTLKTRFEPGPTRWAARLEPTKSALLRNATDGSPRILISRSAYLLHRCLNGGWHWKQDNSGNIVGALPMKDRFSHPGDAFSYMVSVLFPYAKQTDARKVMSIEARMKLARSYRGGNYQRRAVG